MGRRLTLSHQGKVFLDRWGVEVGGYGIFVHHIAGPDPGLDLHDHPWPFVSLIVRGSYLEQTADTREAWMTTLRAWGRWSIHTMPLTRAHRITLAQPGTWTVVFHGRKARTWGFYLDAENRWVPWDIYDYAGRRPNTAESSDPAEMMSELHPPCAQCGSPTIDATGWETPPTLCTSSECPTNDETRV